MQRDLPQKVSTGVLASCPEHRPVYFPHQGMAAFGVVFWTQISMANDEMDGDDLRTRGSATP